ncbi:response regulator transcription factor [Aurantibacter sp.]|uniref:response regulator transcription factor n=1 Tax=Aurantibacter sp. TaxID=2807103 RepID=UPI0032672732
MIKVAITDDHLLVMQGIESMLQFESSIKITGKYSSAEKTLEALSEEQPDVLLLDINLPDINGIDLCKQLLGLYPELKIIALSSHDDTNFVKRILKNGASGYLLKNTSKEELLEAFETVLSDGQYLQPNIQQKLLNQSLGTQKRNTLKPKLTRREKEVLAAICEEMTTQEIAEQLFISPKTVETHRMNLISKLGARNSVGLVKIAIEQELLKD